MSEVAARRVETHDDLKEPGDFIFFGREGVEGHGGMIYLCPCGCHAEGCLRFRPCDPPHPSWQWNGSEDKPTLAPSIKRTSGCQWHGYLTDGVFRSC